MHARTVNIHLNDTHIGISQDDANDPSFRRDIFMKLVAHMRKRGWTVSPDPTVLRRYKSISRNCKVARKGHLKAHVEICGRSCEVTFWSDAARRDNPHGQRYDFDKFDRMPYLDQKRFLLERQKILDWLTAQCRATITRPVSRRSHKTALDYIAAQYAESWHSDKALGRPVCKYDYNARAADGGAVTHGCTVWFRGQDGRWRRGQAFYNINNMWWVVENRFRWTNLACFELYLRQPANLREKRNDRSRRRALERELKHALQASDYLRADVVNRILFGDDAPHYIWSRKNDAYYGTDYSGYTKSQLNAGRYTRAEAEAECRRVPHILEMVCPNGARVRFDETNTERTG